MYHRTLLGISAFAATVLAQAPGPLTPEVHPFLSSQKCTTHSGCIVQNTSIVLDSNYRWLHNVDGYTNCVTAGFNSTFCPDAATCGKTCVLEGVDYSSYGISTAEDALTLNLYTMKGNETSMSSPRVYLMSDESTYEKFSLLNQEFTFDVDVSAVPCGINGALYFSEMDGKGDLGPHNTAGAKYGTGYCDAQCPNQNFVKGEANLNGTKGSCCNEMDIWEANNAATAFTPHPCNISGVYACEGASCGSDTANHYNSVCDKDGCDFNAYRMGDHAYYGVGANNTINTSKKFTVVTQFLTHDNSTNGTLSEIRRIYVQDGKVYQNAAVKVPGLSADTSISQPYCEAEKKVLGGTDAFTAQGGMAGMGGALGRGMVLALSIWNDASSGMAWLDSVSPSDGDATKPGVARGPCAVGSGNPSDLMKNYPDAKVVFSNIKSGDIGSTFNAIRHVRRGSERFQW